MFTEILNSRGIRVTHISLETGIVPVAISLLATFGAACKLPEEEKKGHIN